MAKMFRDVSQIVVNAKDLGVSVRFCITKAPEGALRAPGGKGMHSSAKASSNEAFERLMWEDCETLLCIPACGVYSDRAK